jgi:ubiquinone/menaquinone biosynthesis C-methylase UbiE
VNQPADEKLRIWDAYWQDSRLQSAGPDNAPDIEAALDAHWAQLAAAIPDGGQVLDLACGNGAVASVVARVSQEMGKALKVHGIDAAAIDPPRYVTRLAALLRTIAFHGNTRMEELPFQAGTFNAVFSQYGYEFGDMGKTTSEIVRVLKPRGSVVILALPASSHVVDAASKRVKQSQHLLTQTKLFDVALAVAQALHNVESSGEGRDTKQYLERFNGEVERAISRFANTDSDVVMAMIIALQRVFTDRKTMDINTQLASINNMRKRLSEGAARAEATTKAALGDAGLNGLRRRLTEGGHLHLLESKPLSVGSHGTVAWRVVAQKASP